MKVRLHGTRQAARLARDKLQRDLLGGNSVYMVGSCRARLLHIIHISAFLRSVFFKENWGNCSRQYVPRGNKKLKLKLPLRLAAVARLLCAACRRVNAPVVFLCFYICGAAVALPVASRVNAAWVSLSLVNHGLSIASILACNKNKYWSHIYSIRVIPYMI